jgi:HAD domain in Swiss Army Knife RNA repair proteins
MADGRPLILIDVDGVLNPHLGPLRDGYTEYRLLQFRVRLSMEHGVQLQKVAYETGAELVWATTWEHNANEYIGCQIGLPPLPVIEVANRSSRWKFGAVLDYAVGRPLLWFDDDFHLFPAEEEWFLQERMAEAVAGGHHDYTRLHHVDPRVGLTQKDFDKALSWGNNLLRK